MSPTPEIRKDTVNNRFVILSPARSKRPSDFKSKSNPNPNQPSQSTTCPFCAGNEHQCAPEIFRSPEHGSWKVRCIENLYPALSRDVNNEGGDVSGGGVVTSGFGFHDVIIETPEHEVKLSGLDKEGVKDVLLAYKKRVAQLCAVDAIRYVQKGTRGDKGYGS
ncbi:ADP-glucose phosphorylase [Tanacetum coccineum]